MAAAESGRSGLPLTMVATLQYVSTLFTAGNVERIPFPLHCTYARVECVR